MESQDDVHSPSFFCFWNGGADTWVDGPYSAMSSALISSRSVYLDCPMPSWDQFKAISGYTGSMTEHFTLTLSIYHYAPMTESQSLEADGVLISYKGAPKGNTLDFTIFAPPSTPPPSPPPPPPPPPSPPPPAVISSCSQAYSGPGDYKADFGEGEVNVRCVERNGEMWTQILGTGNSVNHCSYSENSFTKDAWLTYSTTGVSGNGERGTWTCSASEARYASATDNCQHMYIPMRLPFTFSRLYFEGTVYSSGGTGTPCFDWPDAASNKGSYCDHNTCNTEMRNGGIAVSREETINSNEAIWYLPRTPHHTTPTQAAASPLLSLLHLTPSPS